MFNYYAYLNVVWSLFANLFNVRRRYYSISPIRQIRISLHFLWYKISFFFFFTFFRYRRHWYFSTFWFFRAYKHAHFFLLSDILLKERIPFTFKNLSDFFFAKCKKHWTKILVFISSILLSLFVELLTKGCREMKNCKLLFV